MKSNLTKVKKYLDSKFPFSEQEYWDKSGLNYGDGRKSVNGIVVALDLTKDVFDKAMQTKASLIVLHHPFIFEDKETDITNAPYKKEILHRVINSGIGVLVLHTNYDKAENGMSAEVAKRLKWNISSQLKYGAMVKVKNKSLHAISEHFNDILDAPIKSANVNDEFIVNKLAIIPGAGSIEDILAYKNIGADLIITSDIKWNTWVTASELGISLAQVTHGIEHVFVGHITRLLKRNFKDIDIHAM